MTVRFARPFIRHNKADPAWLRALPDLLAAITPDSVDRLPASLLHTICAVYTALAPAEPQHGRELLKFLGDAPYRRTCSGG